MSKPIVLCKRAMIGLAAWAGVAAGAWAADAPRGANPADLAANHELAERFCEMGQANIHAQKLLPESLPEFVAALRAAIRLDPTEPRYARLLIDALEPTHDAAATLDAVNAYLKLQPDDRVAQKKAIDLHAVLMETADAKSNYYKYIVSTRQIPDEVRSYAAVRCAEVLSDRSQDAAADEMIVNAIKINPMNIEALRQRYLAMVHDPKSSPYERLEVLVQLLRASPQDVQVCAHIGHELASAGLADVAVQWYAMPFAWRKLPEMDDLRECLVQFIVAGQAQNIVGLPSGRPNDYGGMAFRIFQRTGDVPTLFILLLAEKEAGSKDDQEKVRLMATNFLYNRLVNVRIAAGDTGATTRPYTEPSTLPSIDFDADIKRLQDSGKSDLVAEYGEAMTDLAWFYIAFTPNPGDADPVIAAREALLPNEEVANARLEGWRKHADGQDSGAELKFKAVMDRDPLAALGMIEIRQNDPASHDQIAAMARKLLADNPTGLVAAFLADSLRTRGFRAPRSEIADAMVAQLNQLPKDWPLSFTTQPQHFYAVRIVPQQVSYEFGQPMLATLTIQNLGNQPLTIDASGAIRPTVVFDAQIRGMEKGSVPNVAVEQIWGRGVLGPMEGVSQVVRLDQGSFASALRSNPTVSIPISFSAATNPMPTAQGGRMEPDPGGYRVSSTSLAERKAAPLLSQDLYRQQAAGRLSSGTAVEKMRTAELFSYTVTVLLASAPKDEPKDMAAGRMRSAQELAQGVRLAASDDDPRVHAVGMFQSMRITGTSAEASALMGKMTANANWFERMLALAGVASNEKLSAACAAQLDDDADPLVRQYAKSVKEYNRQLAIKQAATATSPTTDSSAPDLASPLLPPGAGLAAPPEWPKPPATTPAIPATLPTPDATAPVTLPSVP